MSSASPATVPPHGTSMVVVFAVICAVVGSPDALLALEPLLQREDYA